MHVVLGATGHIGSRLARLLLERGEAVRIVGRKPDRMAFLQGRGAVPLMGSLEDADFLVRACTGARTLFSMIPPQPYARDLRSFQARVGAAIAAAVAATGITHVVNLSSLGAHLPEGTGPIAGLHEHEERLNALPGLNVLHLRAGYFMENLLLNIDLIKANGINGSPIRGDLRIPVIATRDIADVAARSLATLDFRDIAIWELLGQRDLTMREMTRLLGRAVGLPALRYVEFSADETERAMVNTGVSRDVARLTCQMYQAFNDGRITSGLVRTSRNTTATRFEEFADVFAASYDGAKKGQIEQLALSR
jgi:uncharacterized protein YbjT (DUF2867 family)